MSTGYSPLHGLVIVHLAVRANIIVSRARPRPIVQLNRSTRVSDCGQWASRRRAHFQPVEADFQSVTKQETGSLGFYTTTNCFCPLIQSYLALKSTVETLIEFVFLPEWPLRFCTQYTTHRAFIPPPLNNSDFRTFRNKLCKKRVRILKYFYLVNSPQQYR